MLAGRLWASSSQERAYANLRTAVWKVRQSQPGVIQCRRDSVGLRPGVTVDYDPAMVDLTAITAAIEDAGYPVS